MADSPERDPEIRRRAAWLLGMLALVAALIVVVSVVFFNGGEQNTDDNAGPTVFPTPPTTSASRPPSPSDAASSSADTSGSPTGSGSGSGSGSSSPSAGSGGKPSCPSDDKCTLDSDIGNAIDAVNAYRAENDKNPVDGTVSQDAQRCALSEGDDCSGGWSQTQVPVKGKRVDGAAAVDKLPSRKRLLNDMTSFEVGWAYDPGSKTAYLAVIRQDG